MTVRKPCTQTLKTRHLKLNKCLTCLGPEASVTELTAAAVAAAKLDDLALLNDRPRLKRKEQATEPCPAIDQPRLPQLNRYSSNPASKRRMWVHRGLACIILKRSRRCPRSSGTVVMSPVKVCVRSCCCSFCAKSADVYVPQ